MENNKEMIKAFLDSRGYSNNFEILNDDDKIPFKCVGCGNCCKKRDENSIILYPHDIYLIAKNKNITTSELLFRYCDFCIGTNTYLPVTTIKTENGDCIFLNKGKCSIQEHKPATCALFPLGRAASNVTNEIIYFLQKDEVCGLSENTVTLKEWKEKYKLIESEKAISLFEEHLTSILDTFDLKNLKNASEKDFVDLQSMLTRIMYNYDITEAFEEQFEEQMNDIYGFLLGFAHKNEHLNLLKAKIDKEKFLRFMEKQHEMVVKELKKTHNELEVAVYEITYQLYKDESDNKIAQELKQFIKEHTENKKNGIISEKLQKKIIEKYAEYKNIK